jgi:hypothetical protein
LIEGGGGGRGDYWRELLHIAYLGLTGKRKDGIFVSKNYASKEKKSKISIGDSRLILC